LLAAEAAQPQVPRAGRPDTASAEPWELASGALVSGTAGSGVAESGVAASGVVAAEDPPALRRPSSARIAGRTSWTSPTTEYVARCIMGASGSVFTARITVESMHPTQCWVAPLMPHAMYSSGATFVPVRPTWSRCGRQPLLVATREHPTTPPSA